MPVGLYCFVNYIKPISTNMFFIFSVSRKYVFIIPFYGILNPFDFHIEYPHHLLYVSISELADFRPARE